MTITYTKVHRTTGYEIEKHLIEIEVKKKSFIKEAYERDIKNIDRIIINNQFPLDSFKDGREFAQQEIERLDKEIEKLRK